MSQQELLITAFAMTVGIMTVFISVAAFVYIIKYQIKRNVKVNIYVKRVVLVAFILGIIVFLISAQNLDLKSLGF